MVFKQKVMLMMKKKRGTIYFIMIVLVVITLLISPFSISPIKTWWTNWIEPIISMTTLTIAAFVWLGESMEDWEDSLPKKVTVSFFFKDKEVMRCERAYLAGESDIRAWGQQLGGQMAGVQFLSLDPLIQQKPGEVIRDSETQEIIKLYSVSFVLTALPEKKTEDNAANKKFLECINKGGNVVWQRDPATGHFKEKQYCMNCA